MGRPTDGSPREPRAGPEDVSVRVLTQFLEAIVEAARDGVLAVAPDRRVLAVNRRFFDLWGLGPDSVAPGSPSPALSAAQRDQIADPEAFEDAIRWGHEHPERSQTLDVELNDGRLIEGYAAPLHDDGGRYLGRVWFMHDETERRRGESFRNGLVEQLHRAQRAQRFLLDTSDALARTSGFAETLDALARAAVPRLGDICVIDVLEAGGGIVRMAAVHADRELQDEVSRLRRYSPDPDGAHPSATAIREGRSQWMTDLDSDVLRAQAADPDHYELISSLGYSSCMSVPLRAGVEVLGALTLVTCGSSRRLARDDLDLAENLAGRVALVVAKERRYDNERRTSHALQSSLLAARRPEIAGLEVAVRYLPGTIDNEVGGDFYDVTRGRAGDAALAVGDVAGHDIEAAATMAQLRSVCRALGQQSDTPATLVNSLQAIWEDLDFDRIATAVFVHLGPATGRLRVASAGHPPPLMVTGEGAWYPPVPTGPPLGSPAGTYRDWVGELAPGAALVLYTDGMIEDRQTDVGTGLRRLEAAATRAPSLEAEALADHLLASLSGVARADDVALLVARRPGARPG